MNQNYQANSAQKQFNVRKVLIGLAVLAIAVLVIVLVVFGIQDGAVLGEDNDEITSEEVKSQVKSLIMVNEEENPTVAEIRDVERLQSENPSLYANVENGDYLLVYSDQAIIYSPDKDKLIKVAPITLTGVDEAQ
jgi:hypothetical protein